jgi:NAD(P)-dependent dehydrogenase (short-subunit alcohol dehydrogenase family)
MSEPFRGNVVILTGASSGIGLELARLLARQGARLALAGRAAAPLEAAARECAALGGEALAVPTDVARRDDCRVLVERTLAHFGRLDTLVCNAGISMSARFREIEDVSFFEQLMQVNYMGSVYCTHFALPHLLATRGRIVAVSSLAGKTGVPTRSGYAASKHAQAGFFDTLRIELAGTGVSVTVAYPGFVATPVRERAIGPDGRPLGAGRSPVREERAMPVGECARLILGAMVARRREEVMTLRGKLGQVVKALAPGIVDRIARRAVDRGV